MTQKTIGNHIVIKKLNKKVAKKKELKFLIAKIPKYAIYVCKGIIFIIKYFVQNDFYIHDCFGN